MEVIDINQKSKDNELNHVAVEGMEGRKKVRNVAQVEYRVLSS